MRILHLISQYLPPSQVWLYHQLHHNQQVVQHIATQGFLPHNFYDPRFHFCVSDRGPFRSKISQLRRSQPAERFQSWLMRPVVQCLPNEAKQWGRYVKEQAIDLVHVHFADIAYRYRDFLNALPCPYLVSFYGHDYERAIRKLRTHNRHVLFQLLNRAAMVTAEGPFGARQLTEKWGLSTRIEVQPLGIPIPEDWKRRTRPQRPIRLLQVANLTEKKGQLTSIQAVHQLTQVGVPVRLELVGKPLQAAYAQRLRRYVANNGLEQYVSFRPFVAYDELGAYLAHFDLFLHPSQWATDGDCEGGAPIVLLDVQANGLPVVATEHCDIPAVVAHGKSGLLVPEKDPEALAAAIHQMVNLDAVRYEQFSENAREWVLRNYAIDQTVVQLNQLYASIL